MDYFQILILPLLVCLGLAAVDLFIVLRYTLWARRVLPRPLDFVPSLALVMLVATIFFGVQSPAFAPQLLVPILVATLLLFLATLPRLFRRSAPAPAARWRWPKAVGALICGALVLLSALRVVEMTTYTAWVYPAMVGLLNAPGGADFSAQGWSQGFSSLVAKLERDYPYTGWKRIDWRALEAEFAPRIAAAEAQGDTRAYYRALREFAWRIPDAHVGLTGDDSGLAEAEVGGSYGLTLLPLDDGRLVVSALPADGQAAQAGIEAGAEIVGWNGLPAAQALAQTTTIWSEYPAATSEGRLLQQARFLPRGPVGSTATLTFRNRGAATARTASLVAAAAPIDEVLAPGPGDLLTTPVESRLLPSGYGYIRIKYELPAPLGFPDAEVRDAVARFSAAHVPGIIVDVRNNLGGESGLTARMLAPFIGQQTVYHYLALPDGPSGTFLPVTTPILIPAAERPYEGRVAVLIDHYSHSAAEDIALFLKQLPTATVVGMSATAGAGGVSETDVALPGGYTLAYPSVQALTGDLAIKIESDGSSGGVAPDLRVPRDDAAVDALAAGRDPVLERAEAALQTASDAAQH